MVVQRNLHCTGPVVVGYGRGTAPILPQRIECHSHRINTFSDCSAGELDVSQCERVAGVNCQGIIVLMGLLGPYREIIAAKCTCAECDNCRMFSCACNTNCFARGDCCSDVFAAEECYSKCLKISVKFPLKSKTFSS